MIERSVNKDGQEQIINNLDEIVKIGDKFLQVRLIKTQKWSNRQEWVAPMPRARFVDINDDDFCYLVKRKELLKLKQNEKQNDS